MANQDEQSGSSAFRRTLGAVVFCSLVGVFLMVAAAVSPVAATEEMTVLPNEVLIQADSGNVFGEVGVEIKTNKDSEKLKIVSIRLKVNGKWLKVPESAYSDLGQPFLNRTELRVESGYDKNPWLYVYFEVNSLDISGRFAPKRIHIAYHNGKFDSRSIETPLSGGSTRWDKTKL